VVTWHDAGRLDRGRGKHDASPGPHFFPEVCDGNPSRVCQQCGEKPRCDESLFCSPQCKAAFAEIAAQAIACGSCDALIDGITEALAAGWSDIEPDLEGYSWNFLGTCPDYRKENP
jgi:hypothetical protein